MPQPPAIERILADIARNQLGLFTTHQVVTAGIDIDSILHRVGTRQVFRVFRGVYRLASAPESERQRALAACLGYPRCSATGRTAAFIHSFPLGHDQLQYFNVSLAGEQSFQGTQRGVTIVRHVHPEPSQAWLSGRVATPIATLLSLAKQLPTQTLARCVDHCIAHRLIVVEASQLWLHNHPAKRVAGRALLLNELDQRTSGVVFRSRTEAKVGGWLRQGSLPPFTSNFAVSVPGHNSIEVDFAWPAQRVCLEVSPFFTHGSQRTQQRDTEKRRQLMGIGWRVVEADDDHLVSQASFSTITGSLHALIVDPTGQ